MCFEWETLEHILNMCLVKGCLHVLCTRLWEYWLGLVYSSKHAWKVEMHKIVFHCVLVHLRISDYFFHINHRYSPYHWKYRIYLKWPQDICQINRTRWMEGTHQSCPHCTLLPPLQQAGVSPGSGRGLPGGPSLNEGAFPAASAAQSAFRWAWLPSWVPPLPQPLCGSMGLPKVENLSAQRDLSIMFCSTKGRKLLLLCCCSCCHLWVPHLFDPSSIPKPLLTVPIKCRAHRPTNGLLISLNQREDSRVDWEVGGGIQVERTILPFRTFFSLGSGVIATA